MYVKLFDRLLSSSLMLEDLHVRWAMIGFLLEADQEGFVYGQPKILARRFSISEEQMQEAIDRLSSPDENSTSEEEDGRRIVPLGRNVWQVVNYGKYRSLKDKETQRAEWRKRQARHRTTKEETNTDTEAEAEVTDSHGLSRDVTQKRDIRSSRKRSKSTPLPDASVFDSWYLSYPRREARANAEAAWAKLSNSEKQACLDRSPEWIKAKLDSGTQKKYFPLPATFLNAKRWTDEVCAEYNQDGMSRFCVTSCDAVRDSWAEKERG